MADPYTYVAGSGVIVPDTADVLDAVAQEFRDALGKPDLVTTGNTPQGALIAAEATARMGVLRNNAAVANQINPDLAGGVFLDALWRLTGGTRRGATYSTCAGVHIAGVPGTLVPSGSLAQTAAGDQFASAADVTLDASGAGVVDFVAVLPGPVVAGVAALNLPVSAVLGWETVTNPAAAVPGQLEESDAAARARRRQTLALQGVALPEAITSALMDTPGVQSLQFRENTSAAAAVIDGINLAAKSIWVCVNGGTDADVAAVLLAKKSLGCGWNGATAVNVTDPTTGQVYPVSFDRPAPRAALVRVTIKATSAVGDPVGAVQQAILDFAAGQLDSESGFTVGASVSPFELAGAISREAPALYVQKVEVAPASTGVYQTTELVLAVNQLATVTAGSITVVLA